MGPGADLPMELFSRVEFSSSEALTGAMSKMEEEAEEVTIGGKKFIKPTDPTAPQGMLAQKIDDKTMEMGTEKYLTREDREVMSDGLAAAWKMAPKHAVRIVVDVDGMEKLKGEIIDEIATMAPQAIAYAELLDAISNLRVTIDLDGKELLTICATGKDEELAEEFADGLDSVFFTAKMALNPGAAPNEEAAEVMKAISAALEANVEGKEVSVRIPRPEGFNKVIQGMMPPGF
jgi:NTP pyrophosphatase (non-canonical NTP hydrolase)